LKAVSTIIKQAIVSEKGTILRDKENRYIFKVHPDANKIEIKKAIETAFDVKVLNVKTIKLKRPLKPLLM